MSARCRLWTAAAVLLTTCLPAATAEETQEGFTAEALRDACENLVLAVRGLSPISQEDPGAMLCLGYLAGWSQAMEGVRDKPFCLPEVAQEHPGDVADLVVTYIDGHPDVRPLAAHQAVLATIVDAFPCEAGDDPEPPPAEESPPQP